ncbi:MAG: DUF4160 domain-containing protein [Thermodesulfobacteriota bacterium]
MSKLEVSPEDYKLTIRFDVPNGRLPASDVTVMLNSVTTITSEIEKHLIKYERKEDKPVIYVAEVRPGSFVIDLILVAGSFAVILRSEEFRGFFKGLTGKEYKPHETTEILGEFIRNILSKSTSKLYKVIPKNINLDNIIKSKSDFFETMDKNESIKEIGFGDDDEFQVKKNEFASHIDSKSIHPLQTETEKKTVIIERAVVVNKDNKWGFKDKETGKRFSALMRDEEFKRDFLHGSKYPLKQTAADDEIFALFEFDSVRKGDSVKKTNWKVLEVYAFNGKTFEGEEDWVNLQDLKKKGEKTISEKETFRQQLTENEFPPLVELFSALREKVQPLSTLQTPRKTQRKTQHSLELTAHRQGGLKFEIFSNEHPPAHFHVTKHDDKSATYSIESGEYECGDTFGRKDRRTIKTWYKKNCKLLVKKWNDLRPYNCPVGTIDSSVCDKN